MDEVVCANLEDLGPHRTHQERGFNKEMKGWREKETHTFL